MDMKKELGQALSTRRRYLKITQAKLSEMSGVSVRTIKAIEKGTANPSLENLNTLLKLLGLEVKFVNRSSHE